MTALQDRLPDRWLMGLLGFFATIFVANGVLVYLAVSTAPTIEPSYEQRVGEGGDRPSPPPR